MAKIELSLPYVLQNEGGARYTNIPGDAGGPTKYGITQRTLAGWRHRPVSAQDVKNLTLEEATAIYKAHYWDVCKLDFVNDQGCATAIFDCATNRGPGVAIRYRNDACQRLGKAHVNDCEPADFIRVFEGLMEAGYRAIVASRPSQVKFLRGWLNRARRLFSLIRRKK